MSCTGTNIPDSRNSDHEEDSGSAENWWEHSAAKGERIIGEELMKDNSMAPKAKKKKVAEQKVMLEREAQ